jgi:hypothetical protein
VAVVVLNIRFAQRLDRRRVTVFRFSAVLGFR